MPYLLFVSGLHKYIKCGIVWLKWAEEREKKVKWEDYKIEREKNYSVPPYTYGSKLSSNQIKNVVSYQVSVHKINNILLRSTKARNFYQRVLKNVCYIPLFCSEPKIAL